MRVFLDVVNTGPGDNFRALRPLGAVHAFFRRLRITRSGVVIEDIMDYNRVHEMFDILASPQARLITKAEGFGNNTDNKNIVDPNTLLGIHSQMTVCLKPLSGILMQSKYIPLRH